MDAGDLQEVDLYQRDVCPSCHRGLSKSDWIAYAKHCPYCKETQVLAENFNGTIQVVLADNCPNVQDCPANGIRQLNLETVRS